MSGTFKDKRNHSLAIQEQNSSRMRFWGISCISGKIYKQIVHQRFRLTMAVLDPASVDEDCEDKIVSLVVIHNEHEFLLCVLKHGEIYQMNLNVIFDDGDNVVFYIRGQGTVHLTGYQMIDSVDDVYQDDSRNLCPLTEFPKTPGKLEVRKKKAISEDPNHLVLLNQEELDDDSEDEDDDFDVELEEADESESSEDDVDDDDDDDHADSEEVYEDCQELTGLIDQDDYQEDDTENIRPSTRSKRKIMQENNLEPQKRIKSNAVDRSNFYENSTSFMRYLNDASENSDEDTQNSSIGNTPMPKKIIKVESVSSEKKKNKKKLHETLNNSVSQDKSAISEATKSMLKFEMKTPTAKSTPIKIKDEMKTPVEGTPHNRSMGGKSKIPVVPIGNGIEAQDVVVGLGPEATKGRQVSIFYVGRLENKAIFDSRVAPKKPFSFRLGVPEVIKGLDIGVQGMRVGGKRKLKIPPNMAYGSSTKKNVPPNSTLFFLIELHNVN